MSHPFEIAGGTVTGQAHAGAGRNNQDAYCWASTEEGLIAVVCDGCGSGLHNEVGAHLGARLTVQAIARLLPSNLEIAELLEQVRQDVLERLRLLATEISFPPRISSEPTVRASFSRTVSEYFLFTIVGLVATSARATLFSVGDGLIVINGDRHRLGPFPNNEPPYIGYALLPAASACGTGEHSAFRIHGSLPVDGIRSLLIGTDGAADLDAMADHELHGREERIGLLSQFWTDDRVSRNSDMVRRRLTVMNRGPRGGLLSDDTTLVVVRRKALEA
ncbi:MAG: protein phosphatase 2C domain-containing protein [Pseudomonadota bacterium]